MKVPQRWPSPISVTFLGRTQGWSYWAGLKLSVQACFICVPALGSTGMLRGHRSPVSCPEWVLGFPVWHSWEQHWWPQQHSSAESCSSRHCVTFHLQLPHPYIQTFMILLVLTSNDTDFLLPFLRGSQQPVSRGCSFQLLLQYSHHSRLSKIIMRHILQLLPWSCSTL